MIKSSQLNQERSNLYDFECLIDDLDQLYLESMKQQLHQSQSDQKNDQEQSNGNDDFKNGEQFIVESTPIEKTFGLIQYDEKVYNKIYQDTINQIQNQSKQYVQKLDINIRNFHFRNSRLFKDLLYKTFTNKNALFMSFNERFLTNIANQNWKFDLLPGKNVRNWPFNQQQLLLNLEKQEDLSFFKEPLIFRQDFITEVKEYIERKKKEKEYDEMIVGSKILYQLFIKSGDIENILKIEQLSENMNDIEDVEKKREFEEYILSDIERIIREEKKEEYHQMRQENDMGGFKILINNQFYNLNFQNNSMTTDGEYLYIYVSGVNGRILKIGTGRGETIAGKVYVKKVINRQEQVSWVWIKNKLYLRSSSRNLGILECLDPSTFELLGLVQLNCPEIFNNQHHQFINKQFPLLTDGHSLFIICKKLYIDSQHNQNTDNQFHSIFSKLQHILKDSQPSSSNSQQDNNILDLKEILKQRYELLLNSENFSEDKKNLLQKEKELLLNFWNAREKKEKDQLSKQDSLLDRLNYKELLLKDQLFSKIRKNELLKGEDEIIDDLDENIKEEIFKGRIDKFIIKREQNMDFEELKKVFDFSEDKKDNFKDFILKKQQQIQQSSKSKYKNNENKSNNKDNKNANTQQSQGNINDQVIKVVEFVLYKFDLEVKEEEEKVEIIQDSELVMELVNSFNGLYSYEECAKALASNKEDIAEAAAHLVDETDKDIQKTVVSVTAQTLLCQSELAHSDLTLKNLHKTKDIYTKENSLLYFSDVDSLNWTINHQHLSIYVRNQVHIFSTNPNHNYPIQIPQDQNNLSYYHFLLSLSKTNINKQSNLITLIEQKFDKMSQEEKDILKKFQDIYNLKSDEILKRLLESEITEIKQVEHQFQLKGSYLKTVQSNIQQGQSSDKICFDPINRIFYKLNWNSVMNKCVLPSLITVSYDYSNYQEMDLFNCKHLYQPNSNFILSLNLFILQLQKHRYTRPAILNNINHTLSVTLSHINKTIEDIKNMSQHEKHLKKINDLKNKIQSRLTKLNSIQNNHNQHNLIELKPQYAYSLNGQFHINIQLISKLNHTQDPYLTECLQRLLLVNLKHSDDMILIHQKKQSIIENYVNQLYQKCINNYKDVSELEKQIIVMSFNVFLYSVKQKVQFFILIIREGDLFKRFFDLYFKESGSMDQEFAFKQNTIMQIEKNEIMKINRKQFNFSLGILLMDKIDHYREVSKIQNQYEYLQGMLEVKEEIKQMSEYKGIWMRAMGDELRKSEDKQKLRGLVRIIGSMLIEGQLELEKIEEQQVQLYAEKHQEILVNYLLLLKDLLQNPLISELTDDILRSVKLFSYSCIQSIQTYFYLENDHCLHSLILNIVSKLMELGTENKVGTISEGVSMSEEIVIETNHPYERGKSIKFESLKLSQNVIGVQVELDDRCMSDYDNDYLYVQAWYDQEQGQGMNYENKNKSHIVTNNLTVTGKVSPGKKFILLGNNIQVDFNTSGVAKSNTNLNKWGFRLILRPIYSSQQHPQSLSLSLLTLALMDINFKYTSVHNHPNNQVLGWNFIKNGLANFQLSLYQQTNNPNQLTPYFLNTLYSLNYSPQPNPLFINSNHHNRFLYYQQSSSNQKKQYPTLISLFKSGKLKLDQNLNNIYDEIEKQQGENYEKLKQLNLTLQEPIQIQSLKRRASTFKQQYQDEWNKLQILFLLTCLYHKSEINTVINNSSTIIQSRINEIIVQILQIRNQILTFMANRVQDHQLQFDTLIEIIELYNQQIPKQNTSTQIESNPQTSHQINLKSSSELIIAKNKIKVKINKNIESQQQYQEQQQNEKNKIKQQLKYQKKKKNKQKFNNNNDIQNKIQIQQEHQDIQQKEGHEDLYIEIKKQDIILNADLEMKMKQNIQQNYAGNDDKIKRICNQMNILYQAEDQKKCLDEVFEKMKELIFQKCLLNKDTKEIVYKEKETVFEKIQMQVKNILFFTLFLEPNQNTLKPLGLLNRSFSCPTQYGNTTNNNQQQQKEQSKMIQIIKYNQKDQQQQYCNENCEIEQMIFGLVKNNQDCDQLVGEIQNENMKAILKVKGLIINEQLYEVIRKVDWVQKYIYVNNELNNIKSVNKQVKKQLDNEIEKYIQMKMDRFNQDFETFNQIIKEVILKKKLNEDIYQFIIEYIKIQLKMLQELSQNIFQIQYLSNIFLKNVLQLALVSVILSYFQESKELMQLSKLVHQSIYMLVTRYNNNQQVYPYIYFINLFYIFNYKQVGTIIIELFNLEIGFRANTNSLNLRILNRINDILVQDRLNFLISILYHKKLPNIIQKNLSQFYLVIYYSNSVNLIHIINKLLQQSNINNASHNISILPSLNIYNHSLKNYKEIYVRNNYNNIEQQEYKKQSAKLQESFLKSNFDVLDMLLYKLGETVLLRSGKNCLRELAHKQQMESIEEISNELVNNQVNKKNTVVLVHLYNEEDIVFLFRVLFFWEQLYPTFTAKWPKTYEEYMNRSKDNNKINQLKASNMQSPTNTNSTNLQNERLLIELAEINNLEERQDLMPIAWQFMYLPDLYLDMKLSKLQSQNKSQDNIYKRKIKKTAKKPWTNTNLTKLEKKFEDFNKQQEEIKEDDDVEVKEEKFRVKTWINLVQHILKELHAIAAILNQQGYTLIQVFNNQIKKQTFLQLLSMAINGQLRKIEKAESKLNLKNQEKYDVEALIAQQQGSNKEKSNMKISECSYKVFKEFDNCLNQVNNISKNPVTSQECFYNESAKYCQVIHENISGGNSQQLLIQQIIELVSKHDDKGLMEKGLEILKVMENKEWAQIDQDEQNRVVGLFVAIGGWDQQVQRGCTVSIRNNNYFVVQSGSQFVNLLSYNDHALTVQQVQHSQFTLISNSLSLQLPFKSLISIYLFLDQQLNSYSNKHKYQSHFFTILILIKSLLDVISNHNHHLIQDQPQLLSSYIHKLIQNTKQSENNNEWNIKRDFIQNWGRLNDRLDKNQGEFRFYEQKKELKDYKLVMDKEEEKVCIKRSKSKLAESDDWKEDKYCLVKSNYEQRLTEVVQSVQEHKMLKYWEKHIIPKLMDYTRSSFKAFEFEDFFEQLRQPLRIGNQNGAAEVAYIMCENRLPSGVILPDQNHDWSTLSVEELQLGSYVLCKLSNKNYSPFHTLFNNMNNQFLTHLPAQVLAIETKSNSVLLLFNDHYQSQFYTLFLPITQLKPSQISNTFSFKKSTLYSSLFSSFNHLISLSSRNSILKLYNIQNNQISLNSNHIHLKQLLFYYSEKTLKNDQISGWLNIDKDCINLEKQAEIVTYLHRLFKNSNNEYCQQVVQYIDELSQQIIEIISKNSVVVDLKKEGEAIQLKDLLNKDDDLQGLVISFTKESQLCGYSELKFFEDESNVIVHYSGGKEIKKNLSPILLNNINTQVKYIFNSGALPPYMQDQQDTKLQFLLQGVPKEWGLFNWLLDQFSTALLHLEDKEIGYQIINTLMKVLTGLYNRLKTPSVLKQQLVIQLKRMIVKIRYLIGFLGESTSKSDHLQKQFVPFELFDQLVKQVDSKIKNGSMSDMVSQYVQQECELCALILSNFKDNQENIHSIYRDGPQWLYQLAELFNILQYLGNKNNLANQIKGQIKQQISLDIQWDRIIYVENLPREWSVEFINKQIKDILKSHNSRVLNVDLDIVNLEHEQSRSVMIILDGWVELDIDEKMREQIEIEMKEQQQEQPQESQEEVNKIYNCDVCTLENNWENTVCEICNSPRPANYMTQHLNNNNNNDNKNNNDQKKTDLDEIATKRNKKEKERFEKIIHDIHQLIQNYYLSIKESKLNQLTNLKTQIANIESAQKKQEYKDIKKEKKIKYDKNAQQTFALNKIQKKQEEDKLILQYNKEIEQINYWINEEFYNMECLIFCGRNIPEIRYKQFQQVLVKRLIDNNDNNNLLKKEVINQVKNEEIINQLQKLVDEGNGIKCFQILQDMGFDFWLQKSGLEKNKDYNINLGVDQIKQLKKYIEIELCKETKNVLVYSGLSIRFPKDQKTLGVEIKETINMEEEMILGSSSYQQELKRLDLNQVRYQWEIVKMLNKLISETLEYIDIENSTKREEGLLMNIGSYLSLYRDLWMTPIRVDLAQNVLHKTAVERTNVPKVKLERLKLNSKQQYAFIKAFEQIQDVHASQLRPVKPKGTDPFISFEVVFQGEDVMGETGPYRQFYADISKELQGKESQLGLFIESPNQQAKYGEGLDKFIINPAATSTYQLQLFEFLGVLMGCCIRTGVHLTLDLPVLFWKQLVGQEVNMSDMEEVDKGFIDFIKYLRLCDNEQDFLENYSENYVVSLSNKQMVELVPQGSKKKVHFNDLSQYTHMMWQARINENEEQVLALRKGLLQIIPQPLLNTISAYDMEVWVAGKSKIDFALLKRHTRYAQGLSEDSPLIINFWQVLNELNLMESIRFVKFCWGQERLPTNDEEFERTQTRFMLKPATHYSNSQKDYALPKADTCFFNLQLPDYSSKQILKERLLTAINTDCDSLNAEDQINLDPNAQQDRRDQYYDDDEEYEGRIGEEEEEEE